MRIKKIKGVVKDYDWGNADFIPSLIGGYDGKPQAELWFGCHPLGEAVTEDGERLSAVIRDDKGYLGRDYDRFGGELPFLFKVLAIDRPLSLQCHPTRAQAEDGWKREAQLRAEGKEHDYQDPNPKAEVIAALSPITAMCGFRDIEVIDADLAALMPLSYARYLKAMCKDPRTLFLGLYGLSSDEKKEVLEEFRKGLEDSGGDSWSGLFLTRKGIALECLDKFPGDIGAVFPYLMNVMELQIGEALFLQPDTLHAYVFGNGIELMNASDNVLRGGLTSKRVDLAELERIMDFSSIDPEKARFVKDGYGRGVYTLPEDDFSLLTASSGSYVISGAPVSLVLAVDGVTRFSAGGENLTLEKGECAIIPADTQYTMNVRGRVYIAEAGRRS